VPVDGTKSRLKVPTGGSMYREAVARQMDGSRTWKISNNVLEEPSASIFRVEEPTPKMMAYI
jgi:hypothetical protein